MGTYFLACDIGNTFIKIGLFQESALSNSWTLPSRVDETADSLGLQLLGLLHSAGVGKDTLQAVAAVSVSPMLDSVLAVAVQDYLHCPCLFVPDDLPVPLENRYTRPGEVGADRLVGAFAARTVFPDAPSLIVVDFGTAVTFDCITGETYLGGLIFPGAQAAYEALSRQAAKLPAMRWQPPEEFALGTDTCASIRNGLAYGYAALTEGLCARLAAQLGGEARIIGTGGFAQTISQICPIFAAIFPNLLLDGLASLYARRNPAASPISDISRKKE